MTGTQIIARERAAHALREGWTPEHDDTEHPLGELAEAAAVYALASVLDVQSQRFTNQVFERFWPFGEEDWKPRSPLRMLAKAGSLIAAEIDRRIRAGEKDGLPSGCDLKGYCILPTGHEGECVPY
jgi:hypothetical protein